jgi:DNA (cytosine-5)-methyltransferase 1
MLTYLAMADHFKPKWLLWENVPGVLSSNGGSDFAALLQGLAQLGYGFAYRVLDAQYFGVPQRRRRVFVVGCLGDWRSAAKVLFESESLCRDITPRRSDGQKATGTLTRVFGDRGYDLDQIAGGGYAIDDRYVGKGIANIAPTIGCEMAKQVTNQMIANAEAFFIVDPQTTYGLTGNTIGRKPENGGNGIGYNEDISYTLTKMDVHAVAFNQQASISQGLSISENISPTLDKSKVHGIAQNMRVRRLTPVECEKLQGFPENYTNTPTSSDTTRYRALGNSMAVPVMAWIGKRIKEVEND